LFKISSGLNLWLDLDVVITNSLDDMVLEHSENSLSMPWNWAASGHGGCQSSVMIWRASKETKKIYDLFDPAWAHWPPRNEAGIFWGDQEVITHFRDTDQIKATEIKSGIKSYKYHCREGLPANTRIVIFHGEPKPHTVEEEWFEW
jgi:hypothetical protein